MSRSRSCGQIQTILEHFHGTKKYVFQDRFPSRYTEESGVLVDVEVNETNDESSTPTE